MNSITQGDEISHVRIVGTGLIGTSIGLALAQRGVTVELHDQDLDALSLAKDLLKDSISTARPELVVIATPPEITIQVLLEEFKYNPASIFIDVGSVKNKLQLEVESLPGLSTSFVGTHPMSGRESSGASSAQADLFEGRAWFMTPSAKISDSACELVKNFIQLLGATPYVISAAEHDDLMARISHLPQVLSSLLAASLLDRDSGVDLAGQGLRDMTRLAGSDGELWSQILMENREPVLTALNRYEASLRDFRTALATSSYTAIKNLFLSGNQGKSLISGKHGSKPRNYSNLLIVIKDEPGALSKLFNECAKLQANIEDLSIEHSPGQLTGLITLSFSADDALRVKDYLTSQDWKVHQR